MIFLSSELFFVFFEGLNDKTDSTTNSEERRIVEHLWQELKPLHRLLHAYVRQKMSQMYPGRVQLDQPIPVHLTSMRNNETTEKNFDL